MIWTIDTSKIPDKQLAFWADLILLANKQNCPIDEIIKDMSILLKTKNK